MDGDGIRLVVLIGGVIATIGFNIGLVVWHGSKLVTKIESLTRRAERCDKSSDRLFEKTDQIEVRLAVMDKTLGPISQLNSIEAVERRITKMENMSVRLQHMERKQHRGG